jgi:addiction module HigA family antidote
MKKAIAHPGRLLKRELTARKLSANRLSLDIGVPSGRITDILNARHSITADTAVRLGRYFGNSAQFWLDLQGSVRHCRGRAGEGWRDRETGAAG